VQVLLYMTPILYPVNSFGEETKEHLLMINPLSVIFEHGQLATRFGTTPEDVYDLLAGVGMQVSLLPRYLANEPGLSRSEFCDEFHSQLNYNFIADWNSDIRETSPRKGNV